MTLNPRLLVLYLAVLAAGLLTGCKKDGAVKGDGNPPQLLLNGRGELVDTFKIKTTPRYAFNFEVQDDQTDWTLAVKELDEGLLYYQGKIINDNPVDLQGSGKGQLELRPLDPGSMTFIVEVRDGAERAGTALVQTVARDNLLPVAVLQAVQTDSLAPGQVRIDGAKSFDRDARWGGKVMRYEYKIDNFYEAVVTRPQINYIFPEPGKYRVSLRVQDDEQGWSEPVIRDLVVF